MRQVCSRCLRAVLGVGETRHTALPVRAHIRPLSSYQPRYARKRPQRLSRDAEVQGSTLDVELQLPAVQLESVAEPEVHRVNEQHLNSWTRIGVSPIVARRLLATFPHITMPTPAQRAFLLSVFKGQDVFFKDEMGRGKTLAISIAAITLAYRALESSFSSSSQSSRASSSTVRTVILAPTTHLLHQIERDMLLLDPSFSHPLHPSAPSNEGSRLFAVLNRDVSPDAPVAVHGPPILLATPKELEAQKSYLNLKNVDLVFIDEPDSMLPPLPPRHIGHKELLRHRVNVHPPALVHLLNGLMGIKMETTRRGTSIGSDWSHKKGVQTIWTSGTFDSALRRFVKGRGWVRSHEALMDLDFGPTASEKRLRIREEAVGLSLSDKGKGKGEGESEGQVRDGPITDIHGIQPDHHAITVDLDSGDIASLDSVTTSTSITSREDNTTLRKGAVRPTILETVALLHTTSPPPIGTYALAVPPEGTSLDELGREFKMMGIPSILLSPEILHDPSVLEEFKENDGPSPVLLARRSIVPGIHLPKLHTIYLIGGLDVSSLTPKQGIHDRVVFYDILAGRLGRLGTNLSTSERIVKQRVVSIVPKGSTEEAGLGRVFFGSFSTHATHGVASGQGKGRGTGGDEPAEKRWELKEWDMDEMERLVSESLEA